MRTALLGLALPLVLAAGAFGEEKLGIEAMAGSSTATIGVRWHLTPRFALRPAVSFSRTTSDQNTTVVADQTSVVGTQSSLDWTVGVGLAGLFYLSRAEGFSTYAGVSYARTHESQTVGPLVFPPIDTVTTPDLPGLEQQAAVFPPAHTTANRDTVTALLGAEHPFSKRFTVFGELGIQFTSQALDERVTLPPGQTTAILNGTGSTEKSLVSYTAGVGVVFYVK